MDSACKPEPFAKAQFGAASQTQRRAMSRPTPQLSTPSPRVRAPRATRRRHPEGPPTLSAQALLALGSRSPGRPPGLWPAVQPAVQSAQLPVAPRSSHSHRRQAQWVRPQGRCSTHRQERLRGIRANLIRSPLRLERRVAGSNACREESDGPPIQVRVRKRHWTRAPTSRTHIQTSRTLRGTVDVRPCRYGSPRGGFPTPPVHRRSHEARH